MLSKEQQEIINNSIWVVNCALKKQGLQNNEDLKQSAILYMCRCLERFDPSKNIKWTTFAYKNVYLFIKRTLYKQGLKNRKYVFTDTMQKFSGVIAKQETETTRNTQNQIDKLQMVKAVCTEEECRLLDLKILGYKGQEISEIMGCSKSKIICCMHSIKEKARGMKIYEDLH